MTSDPIARLGLDALPELLAGIPELRAEVRRLREEVETIKARSLVCPRCGSTSFRTTKTSHTGRGTRRLKRCRDCDYRVTTVEVIG